jgi:hypothetical protein
MFHTPLPHTHHTLNINDVASCFYLTCKWWKWEYNAGDLEAQKRPSGEPSKGGRATLALLSLGRPFRLILLPTDFIWPKNINIYDLPRVPSRRGTKKHRNTITEVETAKIGGETPPEPPSEGCTPSPTSSISLPWWRGSNPPLDYGFVAVSWSS